jgi:Reverse transcriptase (RNA-dependent DNA polymerase)
MVLARMYDAQPAAILDGIVPAQPVGIRRRTSDSSLDDECRAKKLLHRLHAAQRTYKSDVSACFGSSRRCLKHSTTRGRRLLRQKRLQFWQTKVEEERSCPRRFGSLLMHWWAVIESPLPMPLVPPSFIPSLTSGFPEFVQRSSQFRCSLSSFWILTASDFVIAMWRLPNKYFKQCMKYPLPTQSIFQVNVRKESTEILAPFVVELFNRSLSTSSVPLVFKAAYIMPLLKKMDLNPADVKSHRPISKLSVLSKLLKRLVAQQFVVYLTTWKLLPELQWAHQKFHSTKAALLKVLSDILKALDTVDVAMLVQLDLSAAFDTVVHKILF